MPSTLSSEAPTSLSRCLSNGFPPVEAPSGEKSSPGVADEPEGKNIFWREMCQTPQDLERQRKEVNLTEFKSVLTPYFIINNSSDLYHKTFPRGLSYTLAQ